MPSPKATRLVSKIPGVIAGSKWMGSPGINTRGLNPSPNVQTNNDTTSNNASSSTQDAPSPTASYTQVTTEESPRKRIRREDYGSNDCTRRTRLTPTSTSTSTSSHVSTPYESGYYVYFGAEDDDDPILDYYHSHGFYGFR
jgi:hypothetical protein